MIQVSNEFKKAIKDPERRIKGYVEVLYDLPNIAITPIVDYTSTYTSANELIDGNRVENNYGTLDYLPLDGSVLTMDNAINTNAGYISDEMFEDIESPVVDLNFESRTIKGVTIYFKDNYATNLTLEFSDYTSITVQPNSEIVQVILEEPKTVTNLSIIVSEMAYSDRKLKIQEIDLGITQVYKDQDLIEFTVDEEVNKLVEEVPINETNITLNNMSDLFNPLNPSGIVPYLSENTLIKPYIGVLTENLGVEYVKMGEFYFDSYTNNSDATTTLVAKNIIKQVEAQELIDDNEEPFLFSIMEEQEFNNYIVNFNYDIANSNWSRNIPTLWWKDKYLLNFLKDAAFYQDNILYGDRNSIIKISKQENTLVDSLTKSELINDVEFKYIDKINKVKVIRPYTISEENVTSRQILQETVTLKKQTEIFAFTVSSPLMIQATVSQTGGTSASIISNGIYMAFIKVTGNVGDNVTITINSTSNRSESTLEYYVGDNNIKDIVLEFNSPINAFATSNVGYVKNTDILSRTPSYEMRFDYNGDPSLEAGDYINVETPYGYKPLFIQKNRFKFDGGLEGSIEGVE